MSASNTNTSVYALTPTRQQHVQQPCGTLAVDASFQFVNIQDLGTIDSPEAHSIPNGVVNWIDVRWSYSIFWADTCTIQYEFTIANGHNPTSAFHRVV